MSSVKISGDKRTWSLIDKLDGLGLLIIGLLCYGYILFFVRLAELNIQLPFLSFPIFIGEIAMILIFLLAATKGIILARKGQLRFNRWHFLLILYFLWVLVKALRGYIGWGPLALRNAALYYYVIFAVYAYFFFNVRFFSPPYLRAYFLLLIAAILGSRPYYRYVFNEYFIFSTFLLLVVLVPRVRPRWLQLAGLLVLPVFTFYHMFLLSRAHLLAVSVALTLGCLYFGFLKIRRLWIRVGTFAAIFVIALLLLSQYGDRPTLKSLGDIDGFKAAFKEYDDYITDKGKTFTPKEFKVQVYNKAHLKRRVQSAFEGNKQAIFLQLDAILEERMKEGSPLFKKFIIASKESMYKAIDDYLESERDLYLQGKIIPFWDLMDVVEKAYKDYITNHPELAQQENENPSSSQLAGVQPGDEHDDQSISSSTSDSGVILEKVPALQDSKNVAAAADIPSAEVRQDQEILIEQIQASESARDFAVQGSNEHSEIAMVMEDFNKNAIPELKASLESSMTGRRSVTANHGTSIFRLLIWRDMFREMRQAKPVWGFGFGRPQRSRSLEIINVGVGEWSRDGYITPHNVTLHYIYRSGVIGVFITIFIIGLIFYLYLGFYRLRSKTGPFLVMILVYWYVVSNLGVVIELPYSAIPFWSFFGLTLAYYHYCQRKAQEEGVV